MSYPAVQAANEKFTTETCDACGLVSCPDKHLCDVPTGAELAAAVADCERQKIDEAYVAVAKSEIKAAWHGQAVAAVEPVLVADCVLAYRDGKGGYAGHAETQRLLREGLTFEQIAVQVGLPVARVVQKFTQIPQERLADVLKAESLLRAGCDNYGDVVRVTSLTSQQVLWLARNLGCESQAALKRQGGGGTKYTAEQIAQAWKLRDEGLSFKRIAEAMPDVLKDTNAAVGMLRRNPRPSDSAQGDGTVAA